MNWNVLLYIIVVGTYFILDKYIFPTKVAKEQLIHKIQFEKEFEIYKELWGELVVLRDLIQEYLLTPKTDSSYKEKAWHILAKLKRQHDRVKLITDRNKPFYGEEVNKNAKKTLIASLERQSPLARYFGRISRGESPFFEEIPDNDYQSIDDEYKIINIIIDDTEKAIRKRIGFK